VLWGSDWPHAGPAGDGRPAGALHPFKPIDDGRALARLRDWAGDAATLARILVANPAQLYGF
jgi:predicted TIM-barrel fold metal-dependent hydrolase